MSEGETNKGLFKSVKCFFEIDFDHHILSLTFLSMQGMDEFLDKYCIDDCSMSRNEATLSWIDEVR